MSIFESLLKNPLFEPEPGLMIWTVISFALLFLVLAKVGYRPLMDIIKKREDGIRESIDDAERTRTEAERLLEDYKKQLAQARKEAERIVEEAKKRGERVRAEIVEKAEKEAQLVLDKASQEAKRQRDQAMADLRARVGDLAILAASRVVAKSLSKEDHLKLIEESIAEVKGFGDKEVEA